MASDTRSNRRRGNVGENSKGASSTTVTSTMDTPPGLRRSARETSSSRKQMEASPSTPPTKKKTKVEVVEDKDSSMSSPVASLRRSERAKKSPSVNTPTSSVKLKSVKQLTMETKDVNKNQQKQHPKPKKGLDARAFKSTFKPQQRRGALQEKETERMDISSQVDSIIDAGSGSKQKEVADSVSGERVGRLEREESVERTCETLEGPNSSFRNFEAESSGNDGEEGPSYSKNGCAEEPHDTSDGEGLNGPGSDGIIEEASDDDHHLVTGDKVIPSTRKRHTVDGDSNAFSMIANKDISDSIEDDVSSPSSGRKRNNHVEACVMCSKRRRVGYESPPQELCSCNSTLNKDRGELDTSFMPEHADKFDGNIEQEGPLDFEFHQNTCVICRLGGKLLCCDGKGCKRTYHISCLDPPLNDMPLGVWHCKWCVKKKIDSGVHSVSEGIESIWDTREVKVPDVEGSQRQLQYFVKYKGLAHIHNRWVPETHLHLEAPLLAENFNQKNQVTSWKKEWTLPHRLLKKRLLVFPLHQKGNHSGHAGDDSDPHYEWLIKWCGLDYENATWELENASFLFSPHVQKLIREYEHRREKAKRVAFLSRVDKSKKETLIELPKLPDGVSYGIGNSHLSSVKKLLEYWKKGQHAVVIDDQERVMKVVLFILSLLPDVCRPFLIISPLSALSLWKAVFFGLAPSADVLIYRGNKDTRRCIRTMEFYDDGGSIMFEVLVSPPEAVVEDFDMLESIRWEAIIVDECQSSKFSTHSEQIKMLTTDVRFLLCSRQIRDTVAEHLNLLALLDSLGDLESCDGLETDSIANLLKLKKKLSQFVAYCCESESSRFVEYWVPVQISYVQLEQYCATLLSNLFSLRLASKKYDSVEALREILISTRKCCDHPYIVDPSLQGMITKGLQEVEYLDVGIKASGKLQLLDAILSEIKKQQSRVVILFQSIRGSGRVSIGDILDDFLRQRFGADSYERVEGGVLQSKKQAALNKFNDKDTGRFVFLLENRACVSSIKLSSVDTVVIFDSDWNPANDLKALHKISIDSQFEHIKIFRLYSPCTVEENFLILAKQETLENHLQSINRITSQMLLMWGASYLFNKLDEFHAGNSTASGTKVLSEQSVVQDVVKEFLGLLFENPEEMDTSNCIISKVQYSGGIYYSSIPLLGELKANMADGEEPHVFWAKLLEGRSPRWKYLPGPPQRNRKRVQYFAESPQKREVEIGEVGKKRKKLGTDSVDPASSKHGLFEVEGAAYKGGAAGNPVNNACQSFPRSTGCASSSPELPTAELEERRTVCDAQNSLNLLLKPEIAKLCEILQLSEDVKFMVERFLQYVIDNHHVNREPASIFQAFQISLCWIGASLLKYKIDRKQSLALAQHHLNFGCKEDEAKNVYSKLRLLKKMFLHNLKDSDSLRGFVSAAEDITNELNAKVSKPVVSSMVDVRLDLAKRSHNQEAVDERVFPQQEQVQKNKVVEKESSRSIKLVQIKCAKRLAKLLQKHEEELLKFNREWDKKRVQLEEEHRLEFALVRSIHTNHPVRIDKLKILDYEFAKKLEEHKSQKDQQLKDLIANQLAEKNVESQKAAHWLAKINSSPQVELLDSSCERSPVLGFEQPNIDASSSDGHDNIDIVKPTSSEGQIPVSSIQDQVISSELGAIAHNRIMGAADSTDMENFAVESSKENERREESDVVTNYIRNQNNEAGKTNIADSLSVELTSESTLENNRRNNVIQNATVTQNNAGGISIITDSVSVELSVVNSAQVQPVVAPLQGVRLPHALDKGSQLPIFTGIQDGDAPTSGNRNVLQQAAASSFNSVDSGATVEINHEAPVIETVEEHQSSPSNQLSVGYSQPDLLPLYGFGPQPHAEGHAARVPQPMELSNQAVPDAGADLVLHPPIDATDLLTHFVQPDLCSSSRVDNQPISEGYNSFQNTGALFGMVGHTTELPSRASHPLGTSSEPHIPIDTPAGGFGANLPIHIAPQVPSRISTLPLYEDPLQTELERLQKEMEHTFKVHEDTKIQLRSDCEKEIEEIVAQIRKKFDTKFQDVEAAFRIKRKELDTNRNKVFLNKILAEAFRSKCLDPRSPATSGMQQAIPSSSMNQLHHQPSHLTGSSIVTVSSSVCPPTTIHQSTAPPQHFHHPSAPVSSIPTGSSSVCPPTTNQQSTTPPPHVHHPAAPVSSIPTRSSSACPPTTQQTTMAPPHGNHTSAPISNIPTGSSPTTGQHSTPPPPHLHHPLATLPSIPPKPPLISPITPSTGRRQIVSEIRAPAPHLQRFRHLTSPSATSLASLPRGISTNHVPNNLSPSSTSGIQAPPPPPLLPSYQSAPNNRPPHPEIAGMVPTPSNSSMSALELLMDVDNRPGARPPNTLPPLSSLDGSFGMLDLSEFDTPGSDGVNTADGFV